MSHSATASEGATSAEFTSQTLATTDVVRTVGVQPTFSGITEGPLAVEQTGGDVRHVFRPMMSESPAPQSRRRRASDKGSLPASAARKAGRQAALKATEEEFKALFERHRALARKRVVGEITASENLELQLVRWELDRIEDARSGPARDMLWAAIEPRRELAHDITSLVKELKSMGVGRRERGPKR